MNRFRAALLVALGACVVCVPPTFADPRDAPTDAAGGEFAVFPAAISLHGPQSRQQLVVESVRQDRLVGDRTAQATFETSDARVATVDANGIVHPVADGKATITAKVGDQQATATVEVSATREPFMWSFRNHVLSVLTKAGCNSGACHGAAAGKKNFRLTLRGYDPHADYEVLTREVLGRRIVKTEPARSLMLLKPTAAVTHGGGKRFDVDSLDYRVLSAWIAAGTPAPADDDPRIESLEVLPVTATLQPQDTQQVIVRARFSDGHSEDVTRWAKFATTDENIVTVDDAGRVTVQGNGEGVVTVWYLNLVAVARISVPFSTDVSPDVYQQAPRQNFIDDLVLAKLQSLNLPPSPLCTNNEFIRRAYLDATGTLPAPDDVERFLADPSPMKRRELIDRLLERPEFVDYWTYKWSDLLLVTSRKLPSSAMWSFYDWIRDSVESNKPWDEFARELITAKGSTLANGAANYFVLHKDPTDLTETTSVALMGMSITCARCHNHPMEKWTQQDYYGMANLFARVKMKDGDAAGDVTVFVSDRGNVNHPRLGKPMAPRPLEAEPMPLAGTADRRDFFADWLTEPDNPYFARALVNRVWANFLGHGLVEAVDDLRATNPASNEELFDALSRHFVQSGFDVKALVRLIMNSAAYQRSSAPIEGNAQDTTYYSHYLIRRLPAEVLLDCLSQVTGVPTDFGGYPKGWRALELPDSSVSSYFLDAFGRPLRETTCECERTEDPSLAQALHLANGPTLNQKLKAGGGVIDKMTEQGHSNEQVLDRLYLAALSRHPTDGERSALLAALDQGPAAPPENADQAKTARRELIEDLFWATLTGKEFLFNH